MGAPGRRLGPQAPIHPELTEEYEVLEGSLEVRIGRDWRTLEAGESASVPPGTVHTFRTGHRPARVRNVHRPALDFEPYIRAPGASRRASGHWAS